MENFGLSSVDIAGAWRKWIGLHVKAVASEISDQAGRHAQIVLGDSAQAQPLLESAVAVVSRYLTIQGGPLHPGRTRTLLRASFRRRLKRQAARLNCRETLGGTSDLEEAVLAFQNRGQGICLAVNPERVVRLLSDKSRTILGLRDVGYNWKEVAYFLGVNESIAKRTFRQELRMAIEIADHPESRQAELQVAKAREEKPNHITPFDEPIWE